MNWLLVGAFIAGLIVAGLARPVAATVRRFARRSRGSASPEDNRVTSIGQVLHLAIQGSPTGVVVVDRSGTVLLSNNRAHEMGLVHDRAMNDTVWRTVGEAFADRDIHDVELSTSVRRVGSRVTDVHVVVKPLTLVDPRFVIAYSTDESEYARMESARRDFVANVSHELKTPVSGMNLLAEALLDAVDDPEHVTYFGSRLQHEVGRMSNLINELISLSKLQGAEALPDMKPVDVSEVISEAIARNQLTADNHGIALVRGDSEPVMVNGNKALLITAVSNLIGNAVNYSENSLPVSITQRIVDEHAVQIRVTDRGIGISEEDRKRVFERFFRVDKARSRSTGGTGLGLAIVKHVVANHGGTIDVWSKLGTGSTFTIELPIYRPEPPSEVPPLAGGTPRGEKALTWVKNRAATRRKDKTQE